MATGSLLFSVAAEEWLKAHSAYIRPSTLKCYRGYLKPLNAFFGSFAVREIHIGNLRSYQLDRSQKVCARLVNAEINCAFIPVLKESNCWCHLSDLYKSLPIQNKRVRQNMSEDEERRLIVMALDSSHPRRLLAGHCLTVMSNTGTGFGELRNLKREDVVFNVECPYVHVNAGVKNEFRIRTIPLNWLALRSLRWIVRRWEDLGGTEPNQYILPHAAERTPEERKAAGHQRTHPPDFTRPMKHIYRAARAILKEAGLERLDPYDMRSNFGTKLANDPNVSDQMFKEIFGHAPKSREIDRYSNQRLEKKAVAVARLALEEEPRVKLIAFPGGKR